MIFYLDVIKGNTYIDLMAVQAVITYSKLDNGNDHQRLDK